MLVERVEISLPRLPAACDGLSIAVIADVHAGFPWRRHEVLRGLLRTVNDLRPDLIAVLGDVVHWHTGASHYVPLLSELRAELGVWACLGNHERGHVWYSKYLGQRDAPGPEEWHQHYAEAGVRLLVNESQPLQVRGERLWIGGVDDSYSGYDDLTATLAPVPRGEFALILSHSPDLMDHPRATDADLVLAGHTHGGQVKLPGLGKPHVSCRLPHQRAEGLSRLNGTYLYVSRGCGEGFPLRYDCPRELPLIILRGMDREPPEAPRRSPDSCPRPPG